MQRVDPRLDNWQSLTSFTASTTLSEKVWRVINNVMGLTAAASLYALASGRTKEVPRMVTYIGYLSLVWVVRKIVQAAIPMCSPIYPAVWKSRAGLKHLGDQSTDQLSRKSYTIEKFSLNKSGIKYAALKISHPSAANEKWSIHALGNYESMEDSMYSIANENLNEYRCNTLLINGPRVGESGGWPTRYQMGAGFEAGLQYLEKNVKATHIVFHGRSLGNGMMSEAVLAHDFKKDVKYLGISVVTFSRLRDIAYGFAGPLAYLLHLTGNELDGVGAAKKLTDLNIKHIIVQHSDETRDDSTDRVIPDSVSLARALKPEGAKNRVFLESPFIYHNSSLPSDVQKSLTTHVEETSKRGTNKFLTSMV